MSAVRTLTLADLAVPRAGGLANALLIVGATGVTALAAQIAIPLPFTPVPITGQTFAVLLTGAVLGGRRAFLAQALYLAEGAGGLPVFAGGGHGFASFAGPTAGYLLAFPFAERGWDRRFVTTLAAMLLGNAMILLLGAALLERFVPAAQVGAAGVLPFLPGDLIKSALAALALPAAWRGVRPWPGARG